MEEEKESPDYFGHAIRFIILCWALSVMTVIVDNKNSKVGIK